MKVTMTDLENEAISSICLEINDLSRAQIKALIKYIIESLDKFVDDYLDRKKKDPGG